MPRSHASLSTSTPATASTPRGTPRWLPPSAPTVASSTKNCSPTNCSLRWRKTAELFSPAAVIGPLQVEEPPGNAPTRHVHTLAILENFRGNLQAIPRPFLGEGGGRRAVATPKRSPMPTRQPPLIRSVTTRPIIQVVAGGKQKSTT